MGMGHRNSLRNREMRYGDTARVDGVCIGEPAFVPEPNRDRFGQAPEKNVRDGSLGLLRAGQSAVSRVVGKVPNQPPKSLSRLAHMPSGDVPFRLLTALPEESAEDRPGGIWA